LEWETMGVALPVIWNALPLKRVLASAVVSDRRPSTRPFRPSGRYPLIDGLLLLIVRCAADGGPAG